MGFRNILGKVVTFGQHVVSKAVEKIGDVLSNSNAKILYKAGWALQDLGEIIDSPFYNSDTATCTEVVDTSGRCKVFFIEASEKVNNRVDEIIDRSSKIIDEIKNQTMPLVPQDVFEEIKKEASDDFFEEIRKDAFDTISEKISVSNKEFENLLRITSDDERNEKCRQYIATTMESTLTTATNKIVSDRNRIINNMLSIVEKFYKTCEEDLLNYQKKQEEINSKKEDMEYLENQFLDETINLSFLSCIISCTNNN